MNLLLGWQEIRYASTLILKSIWKAYFSVALWDFNAPFSPLFSASNNLARSSRAWVFRCGHFTALIARKCTPWNVDFSTVSSFEGFKLHCFSCLINDWKQLDLIMQKCISLPVPFILNYKLATSDWLAFFIVVREGYRINAGQLLALAKKAREIAEFSPRVTDPRNELSSFGIRTEKSFCV